MTNTVIRRATKALAQATDQLRRPQRGLVVLAYHRVGAQSPIEVDLPTALFEEQMAALACDGSVIRLDDAVERLALGEDLTDRVVVTFDDGTEDFATTAAPILECYQVPATIYVATDFIESGKSFPDDGRPLSWNALRDVMDTGLISVGSHTHTHRLFDRITPDAAAEELARSIELIEERLGQTPRHFAYPKAVAPSFFVEEIVRSRFASAALAGTRPNPPGETDLHRLARSPVQTSDGLRYFEQKVNGGMALEDDLRRILNRRRYQGLTR